MKLVLWTLLPSIGLLLAAWNIGRATYDGTPLSWWDAVAAMLSIGLVVLGWLRDWLEERSA